MNIKEVINIPKGTKFLSDVLKKLPHNCILDKGRIGAGGTHIALADEQNCVICVPFKSLITNKIGRGYRALGVDGYTNPLEIRDYVLSNRTGKIIVTYDSLAKVVEVLEDLDFLDCYNILIDEFHLLITQYLFRNKAVRTVLDNYKKFKSFCFMTATVLEDEFILDELMGLDVVICEWEDIREIKVNSLRCESDIKDFTGKIINTYLKEDNSKNAYFFVNSVKFIKEMVKECRLTNKNCRGIWSENNTEVMPIKNSTSLSEPKKINFITSTNFEGVDYFDTNAEVYIISDGDKKHTLIDISTSFIQIAGRIRDADIKQINHIYTETRYSNYANYDEFKDASNRIIEEAPRKIDLMNQAFVPLRGLGDEYVKIRDAMVRETNVNYLNIINDELTIDNNLIKLDLYNFKICKCLYSLRVNLLDEYYAKGFSVESFYIQDLRDNKKIKEKKKTFKELVEELENDLDNIYLQQEAFSRYDFLEEAISKLGFDYMRELKYSISNIKKKLIVLSDLGNENKILRLLKQKLEYTNFISDEDLKNIFSEIYKELNIPKTPKSTDINKYFQTKEKVTTINNIRIRGKVILSEKLIIG